MAPQAKTAKATASTAKISAPPKSTAKISFSTANTASRPPNNVDELNIPPDDEGASEVERMHFTALVQTQAAYANGHMADCTLGDYEYIAMMTKDEITR